LVDYLAGTKGFEEIFLMLFCHGVDSIGLAGVECWRALLARAERRSECEVRLRRVFFSVLTREPLQYLIHSLFQFHV
jgi:hypothetical protein